jgi:dTDP-4-amino-4,6-dideoxygalactose transaminase
MKLHIYPLSTCHHSWFEIKSAPFTGAGEFEMRMKEFFGGRPYVCTFGGRTAIYEVLKYLKRELGARRVLVPAYVCKEAITPINAAGLQPVIVDSDKRTLGISLDGVKLKEKDVILAPNLFGLRTDIARFVRGKGVFVVEDNSASFREPSPYADFAIYSFFKGKEVSGSYGGAFVVNNKKYQGIVESVSLSRPPVSLEIAKYWNYVKWKLKTQRIIYYFGKMIKGNDVKEPVRPLRKFGSELEGMGLSMGRISKALVGISLRKMPEFAKNNRSQLEELKKSVGKAEGLGILSPAAQSNCYPVNVMFKGEGRDSLKEFLEKRGIFSGTYWSYMDEYVDRKKFGGLSFILEHLLQLVLGQPSMDGDDVSFIASAIKEWASARRE